YVALNLSFCEYGCGARPFHPRLFGPRAMEVHDKRQTAQLTTNSGPIQREMTRCDIDCRTQDVESFPDGRKTGWQGIRLLDDRDAVNRATRVADNHRR